MGIQRREPSAAKPQPKKAEVVVSFDDVVDENKSIIRQAAQQHPNGFTP
jgi:hypothetical protein